ncbi:MAG: hypothetical protein QM831_24985 [Kofleriaceae bacterium]
MGRTIDLTLRFVYLAIALLLLAPLAAVLPITGTLVAAGIATIVALVGPRWHDWVGHSPIGRRALGNLARVGDYYRDRPPKPLVYYIAYPLLLPIILWKPEWRREFTVYRRFNVLALVIIVVGGTWDFFRHWQPELGFGPFLGAMIGSFIIQFFAIFALVMPIVTTLVMVRSNKLLLILALVIIVGTGAIGLMAAHRMKDAVQVSTWQRLQLRTRAALTTLEHCVHAGTDPKTCAKSDGALMALAHGLDMANTTLAGDPTAFDIAETRARAELGTYYKADEAAAFHLYYDATSTILYVRHRGSAPIWLGYSRTDKKLLLRSDELAPPARKTLRL